MRYYANRNAQVNGDHEVHEVTCSFMPTDPHRRYLGDFTGCAEAVIEARKHYAKANGCYYCSFACHTS
jgi:hypothetical protein